MKPGDTVFIAPIHRENKTKPYTANVLTVGNNWFTVDGNAVHYKFNVKTLIQKESNIGYSFSYNVYNSENEYLEKLQDFQNRIDIKSKIHTLTNNQVKHIMDVINTNKFL